MQASDWPAATPSARCQPCRGRRGAGRWLLGPNPIDGNDEAGGRSDDAEHAQRQAQFEVFQVSLGCEVFVGALEPAHAVTKRAVSIPGSALISPAVMVALRCERSTLPLRVTFDPSERHAVSLDQRRRGVQSCPLPLLLAAPFVTVDHRPKVFGHRPLALMTPHPHLARDARGIDEDDGWPRHVPGLEVDPNVHAVVADHLAVSVRQQGKWDALTLGEPRHGVEILPINAGDVRASPRPLVQLDLEPRQVALATESPGMPQKDQAEPPTGEAPQRGTSVCSRHGEFEVRRGIAGCERR